MSTSGNQRGPKVLLLDIETAPCAAWIWRLWDKTYSMDFVERDWYIMCWCAKWLGKKEMFRASLPDFASYLTDPEDDGELMKGIWNLLDECDIVVGQNCDDFDLKKLNTRFVFHQMSPPSPYKVIDTLKIAKAKFAFTSNKLNDMAKFLGLGEKHNTGGFSLWRDCMAGKEEAWDKMVEYCAQDVRLLEKVYNILVPYATRTPNFGVYTEDACCPKCGSYLIQRRGFAYTTLNKYQRFQCQKCGAWGRFRLPEKLPVKVLPSV